MAILIYLWENNTADAPSSREGSALDTLGSYQGAFALMGGVGGATVHSIQHTPSHTHNSSARMSPRETLKRGTASQVVQLLREPLLELEEALVVKLIARVKIPSHIKL
jgi:hypothetical protein